jgi:hypothetical protein
MVCIGHLYPLADETIQPAGHAIGLRRKRVYFRLQRGAERLQMGAVEVLELIEDDDVSGADERSD